MTGTIKVSPQQLITTAEEFRTQSGEMTSITGEMLNQVASLSSSWEGDTATAYLTKFKSLETDISVLNRMINEHITDLKDMAEKYSSAENLNTQDATSLQSGIIS
ncbi:MAG: WXG100 family type VII secretion target [Ruminococcus sp.]|nr:WXG100 family type VII secretion target [Ruminococcus sp.]